MRFRLAFAAALAAGLAAAAPAGALNPQHAGLQVALRAQGLYLGPIDAIVGPRTLAAVRAFQHSHGLKVTGIADVRTRRALGPLGVPLFGSRQLKRGSFGWDVAVLQYLLNHRGISVPVNGYMDGPTIRGLRRYQRQLSLASDGIAGPATFAALGLQSQVPVKVTRVSAVRKYVVKPGDSLTAIARRFSTSVSSLARLNKLDPARPLLIGTKLRFLATAATPTALSASNAGVRARLARQLVGTLRDRPETRPRARLDGVRVQQQRRLVSRSAGRHAAAADDVVVRRDRPDRPSGRPRRRR